MTKFELNVHTRAFENRGVQVDFDADAYSALLGELTTVVSQNETPIVDIEPAAIWGMTRRNELLATMAHDLDVYPHSYYSADTRTVSVKADADMDTANQLLLGATRRWAGHVGGELAAAQNADYERRFIRKGIAVGPLAVGAAAGLELGGGDGAFIGGVIGLVGGLTASVLDGYRQPYEQAIKQFANDPRILADYGRIVRFEAV